MVGLIRDIDRGKDGGNIWRWRTLEKYVKENKWTKGAELGLYEGRTFTYLVRNCPDLYMIGVDLFEPQPNSKGPEKYFPGENNLKWDFNSYYNQLSKFCERYTERTKLIRDYTTNAAKEVEDRSLDFVFIDADHSYEGVLEDISVWQHKVRIGGMLFGHDIHWDGVKQAVEEVYGKNGYIIEDDFLWGVVVK